MEDYQINVLARDEKGRGPARRLRAAGRIPAVIYGDSGSRSLSVDGAAFRDLWKQLAGSSALIEIVEEGKEPLRTLIQDVQRDAVTDRFVHIDFKEIAAGKEMETDIPVHIIGEALGVKNEGALIDTHKHELSIRCLPRDLPHYIEVDISALHAGDSIHIEDLPAISGVLFLEDPEEVIVACVMPAAPTEEEVEAEEAAEAEAEAADEASEGEEKEEEKEEES